MIVIFLFINFFTDQRNGNIENSSRKNVKGMSRRCGRSFSRFDKLKSEDRDYTFLVKREKKNG